MLGLYSFNCMLMIGLLVTSDVIYEFNRYMYKSYINQNYTELYLFGDLIKIILFKKDESKY